MKGKVLITGGAGFVGSFIAEECLRQGYLVTIIDNLDPQVHGSDIVAPRFMPPGARFIRGDVRDRELMERELCACDYLFHQAAAVGVGQSMYQIEHYVSVNTLGTAIMLDIIAAKRPAIKKIMVASSMSIYGEGAYTCPHDGLVHPGLRSDADMEQGRWDPVCPICAAALTAAPTSESKPLVPTSVYAVSKKDQEELCLAVGRAYGIPVCALRYFNIYGSRQALSNPYTGVAAIFSSRMLNGNVPLIFEDGHQSRDFIHVSDIVRANMLCLESSMADFKVYNVGTGRSLSVLDLASALAGELKVKPELDIRHRFRAGDIRHCYADTSKIKSELGFEAQVRFEDGVSELVDWVRQERASDQVATAMGELQSRGLIS